MGTTFLETLSRKTGATATTVELYWPEFLSFYLYILEENSKSPVLRDIWFLQYAQKVSLAYI